MHPQQIICRASAFVHPLADYPILERLKVMLSRHFTRQWPTRHLQICPPAFAAVVPTADLAMPNLEPVAADEALVVFLPDDFEPWLHDLAAAMPQLRVHPDIGLQRNVAYLSWSLPPQGGKLPNALWIEFGDVKATILGNEVSADIRVLPIVFVSRHSIGIGGFAPDDESFSEWEEALRICANTKPVCTATELVKARDKAEKYGERPWLFMRYELKNGSRRLAVNWAPVAKMTLAT